MAGSESVRSVLETLVKSLCQNPQAASVSIRQQPGVQTIFLVASADASDTTFLQGANLFPALRLVTTAVGERQHADLPCDFAIAQAQAGGMHSIAAATEGVAPLAATAPKKLVGAPPKAEAAAPQKSAAKKSAPRKSGPAVKRGAKAKPKKPK